MLYKRDALIIIIMLLSFAGCEALKASRPIIPIKEYEKLIAGRVDAQYVGTDTCLKACHSHDKIRRDFEASTMGAQLSRKSGMPVVDCESCHGPGSLAIEGITPEKVEEDKAKGIETKCNYETLIDLKNFLLLPYPSYVLNAIQQMPHSISINGMPQPMQ
jgi:hypothetical protein